jgi:hypothetical protein
MKNLLVFYYSSGKLKVEKMSAAEVILLGCYWDTEVTKVLNITNK